MAHAAAASPGPLNDTTITFSALNNASDGSWLLRLDWRVLAFTTLNLTAFGSTHLGNRGEMRYCFSIPPQPQPEALQRGLHVRAPVLDVGVAILLDI